MSSHVARRLAPFGTTIFSEMSRLAAEYDAINLGQGFPDFPGPEIVKESAKQAIDANLNQYAPSHGTPRLRNAISRMYYDTYGLDADPETEITVTSGATEALLAAMLAFVNPGDEVILLEPFYDSYPAQVTFAGGVPRYVQLYPPDWTFEPDELAAAFSDRTRAILVNSPHNPTGAVFSAAELDLIATLCIRNDALAITDEVYDRIIYDNARHIPLATRPGMRDRTVTINSTGKTFSMTGWKIGYLIAPPELTDAVRKTHQFITFATSTPFQEAMATALEVAPQHEYYVELAALYTRLRDQMRDGLESAGLPVLPCLGSYFLLTDIGELGFPDDAAFCRYLTTEIGVAAIPPSSFYANPASAPLMARFCFAKQPETIAAASERLTALRSR